MSIPRLVVAAPSSGAGKTTVATGLMAALRARGLVVSPHKVGPDYIDPGYHSLATGRPGRNLDPVLVGERLVAPLFLHGASGADIAVVEGVMGLYDGRGSSAEGSTAHVARLLEAPVLLVVDASSQSRSVAALVHGFSSFDPAVRIAGVVLNRVASDRHEQVLRDSLVGVAEVVGVLRRDAAVETPSRHLGLVPVAERPPESMATVERLGKLVESGCDIDRLRQIAGTAGDLQANEWAATVVERAGRPVVAVAGGAAFTFSYAETVELLTAAGAEVVTFDPLRDEALPVEARGLVIGGGFPEVYAEQLSANVPLLQQVRALAASGSPVAAECAGLLYLSRSLDGRPMAGLLGLETAMTDRLTLGYRTTRPATPSWMPDVEVTGHEFHRTAVVGGSAAPAWSTGEGAVAGNVHASYLHLHWAGVPDVAGRFVAAASKVTAA